MVNKGGLHHYHLRKRIHQKHESYPHPDRVKRFYDNFIYVAVVAAPLAHVPQLLKVWVEQDASGVSAISWFFFSALSVVWLVYGVLHKDNHILLVNVSLIIVQALIAIGAMLYA